MEHFFWIGFYMIKKPGCTFIYFTLGFRVKALKKVEAQWNTWYERATDIKGRILVRSKLNQLR